MPQHRKDDDFVEADAADRAEQQRGVADDDIDPQGDEDAPPLPLEADPADVAEQGVAVPYGDDEA